MIFDTIKNAPAEIDQERYNAEARFCRALAYYVLMDAFGNPPFVTEESMTSTPEQIKRADLFEWLEKELTTIKPSLPEKQMNLGVRINIVWISYWHACI